MLLLPLIGDDEQPLVVTVRVAGAGAGSVALTSVQVSPSQGAASPVGTGALSDFVHAGAV